MPSAEASSRTAIEVGAHRVRFLRGGVAAFPAMLEATEGASREVLLEVYWLGADRVGERFRSALVERARKGVRVAWVFDAVGSFATPRSFWAPLVEAGAEVYEFAPIWPLRRRFRAERIPFRDHRKILVVDSEIGFAGGMNIGEQWAPSDATELAFRDDAVEIRGPAVWSLRATCLETLRRCGSRVEPETPARPSDELVRVLTNRIGRRANRAIRGSYMLGLRRASRTVDVASAYFLPGPLFLRAMCAAARRGVRVRMLVPERSDVRIVALAMHSILGRLLAAGVEVYAYTPRVLHSKTAVFDGQLTFIGSHNLDSLSLSFNLECDIVVDSTDFARVVLDAFEDDLAHARCLDLAWWGDRPLLVQTVRLDRGVPQGTALTLSAGDPGRCVGELVVGVDLHGAGQKGAEQADRLTDPAGIGHHGTPFEAPPVPQADLRVVPHRAGSEARTLDPGGGRRARWTRRRGHGRPLSSGTSLSWAVSRVSSSLARRLA